MNYLQICGAALIAIGVIAELQSEDYGDVSSSVLRAPAIACISLGSLLFLLGALGSIGALVEFYSLLLIVSNCIMFDCTVRLYHIKTVFIYPIVRPAVNSYAVSRDWCWSIRISPPRRGNLAMV